METLHLYRCIQFTNILFSRAFSTRFLPVALSLSQFTIVVVSAFALLFYDRIGLLLSYIAVSVILCHAFIVGAITKISSLITSSSAEILNEVAKQRKLIQSGTKAESMREIRIYIANFYFVDPGTLLVTIDIILGNLINVLLAYR